MERLFKEEIAMKKIGISLLTYNHWDYTDKAIDSLIKNINYPSTLVILDDNSTDGTQDNLIQKRIVTMCPSILSVRYIWKRENVGLIKGRNETFKKILEDKDVEYILVVHNDHLITSKMLDGMLEVFDKEPKAAVVGAEIWQGGPPPEDLEAQAQHDYKSEWYRGNSHPVLMKVSALKEVLMPDGNIYDESWAEAKAEAEDIDLLGRLEDAGYKTLVTKTAWAWHKGELTRSEHPDTQKRKVYARTMYERKWNKLKRIPWDHRRNVSY